MKEASENQASSLSIAQSLRFSNLADPSARDVPARSAALLCVLLSPRGERYASGRAYCGLAF